MILLISLWACTDGKNGSGGNKDITGPDNVVMDDSDEGLTVTVEGGTATGWQFGFALESQDWREEACKASDDVCHSLEPGGGFITFRGDLCDDPSDGQTCMPRAYFREQVLTYSIRPDVGTACWTWGHTPGFYPNCTEMNWEGDSY